MRRLTCALFAVACAACGRLEQPANRFRTVLEVASWIEGEILAKELSASLMAIPVLRQDGDVFGSEEGKRRAFNALRSHILGHGSLALRIDYDGNDATIWFSIRYRGALGSTRERYICSFDVRKAKGLWRIVSIAAR